MWAGGNLNDVGGRGTVGGVPLLRGVVEPEDLTIVRNGPHHLGSVGERSAGTAANVFGRQAVGEIGNRYPGATARTSGTPYVPAPAHHPGEEDIANAVEVGITRAAKGNPRPASTGC